MLLIVGILAIVYPACLRESGWCWRELGVLVSVYVPRDKIHSEL
jgi:hypothetical protein